MPFSDVVQVILIIAVAYVALRFIDARASQWTRQSAQQAEDRLWALLAAEIERKLAPIIGDLNDLQGRMDNLIDEREKNTTYAGNASTVLLICGDETFCQSDRHALRRANVDFYRLSKTTATPAEVERELHRAREDHDPYRMIHIAAHASQEGILLGNELADGAWWNDRLDGVRLVVLAVCQGTTIADQLAGLVDVVISVREEIDNTLAGEFTYTFWSYIQEGKDAREAYRLTRKSLPAVAEHVSMRADIRGGKGRAG